MIIFCKIAVMFIFFSDQDSMIDMEDFLEGTPEEQAENLLQDGWGSLVAWRNPLEAFIPNQSNPDLFYHVKLVTMECECTFPAYKGLCVHVNLAMLLSQRKVRDEGAESLEDARLRLAQEAEENRDYLSERLCLTTFHSGIICVTSLSDLSCTCKASFFGFECVGMVLCRLLNPNLTLSEPLPNLKIEYPKQSLEESKKSALSDPETMNVVNSLHSLSSGASFHPGKDSKQLVEDLFVWSQSPKFNDSPALQSLLLRIHRLNNIDMGGNENENDESREESPRPRPNKRSRNRTPIHDSPRKARSRHGHK